MKHAPWSSCFLGFHPSLFHIQGCDLRTNDGDALWQVAVVYEGPVCVQGAGSGVTGNVDSSRQSDLFQARCPG